jgi:hypothetical protein
LSRLTSLQPSLPLEWRVNVSTTSLSQFDPAAKMTTKPRFQSPNKRIHVHKNLSSQSTAEIVALMNDEDALVAAAVKRVLGDVVKR